MVYPISPGYYPVKPLPAERSAPAAPGERARRAQGERVQRDYAILLQNYRLTAGFEGNHFPLEAFSLHQEKILLTYQDKNGARKQAFVTEELLQRLFRQRGVPYERGAAKRFLTSLRTLLESNSLTPWEQALRRLAKEGKGEAADYFRGLLPRVVLFDGHLILQGEGDSREARPLAGSLSQELTERFGLTPAAYRGLLQAMKQELAWVPPAPAPFPLSHVKPYDLLFREQDRTLALGWDKKSGALSALSRPVGYLHTQKTVPLEPRVPLADQQEDFLAGLHAITGGDEGTLDTLAAALAVMAAPALRAPQLTVLYTKKNVAPVRGLLTALFGAQIAAGPIARLLQAEGRKHLLAAQVRGDAVVLLDPSLPTPSQMGDLVTLIQGGRLPVKDKLVPGQAFRSQLHLVYVTHDQKLTEALLAQYQARLVDLSTVEVPWSGGFTPAEAAWLRRNLLAYGCQVLHGESRKAAAPNLPDPELRAFLGACCATGPDLCVSRGELYQAYAAHVTALTGQPPAETPTLFGKRLRKQALPGVEYKVKRYGPEKNTQLCYVGLGLLEAPRPLETAAPNAQGFRALLEAMEALTRPLLE